MSEAKLPPDAVDLVALSLLPLHLRRVIGAELCAGAAPPAVLHRLAADAAALRSRATGVLETTAARGLRAIAWGDEAYPPLLTVIPDPPPVLWVRGDVGALGRLAIAVVGSRAGSPYALSVAGKLAGDLASCGLVVVSGLARGVDSAAHRGALAAGGLTVAVFGCGADIVYPPEHRALACAVAAHGALVSELAPGTRPRARYFPLRNRIISALSRAVVVIEAGEKSGSLITARTALEQGRDVLAVPGNILNGRNRGGHALLRDGAKIVETADDILEELGLSQAGRVDPGHQATASKAAGAGRSDDPILACLTPGDACDLDAIASQTGWSAARILPRLLELELQGIVKRAGGGRFVRIDSSC
jgi:DNA processing protein